jgi:hypothetical protein
MKTYFWALKNRKTNKWFCFEILAEYVHWKRLPRERFIFHSLSEAKKIRKSYGWSHKNIAIFKVKVVHELTK